MKNMPPTQTAADDTCTNASSDSMDRSLTQRTLCERIARYTCPKSVDVVDAISHNPSGKILNRVLREPDWAGRNRRIA